MPEQIAAKLLYKKSAETAEILAPAVGLEPTTHGLTDLMIKSKNLL